MMPKMMKLYSKFGQSIWLDYIDRDILLNGKLKSLVNEGLRGVTSNPTIFYKAILGSDKYDVAIRNLLETNREVDELAFYQWITVEDVQMAADILSPVYQNSNGDDGFVSLEVSPHLAYDSDATIEAARHLWGMVDRPNLMIKVPATVEGLPVIENLISEGINVNVTLLFSVARYKEVAQAYLRGLALNPHPEKVASVASFFVSRVDSKVDIELDKIGNPQALELHGKIAIANAKIAYQHFKAVFNSKQFAEQQKRGARPQRTLWASTSTKNIAYPDVLYVNELIGSQTVNTVTPETLEAFQAHGKLSNTLDAGIETAHRQLDTLSELGISLAQITEALEREGIAKFADSYDQLMAVVKEKCATVARRYAG